jgi:hypothetical protein
LAGMMMAFYPFDFAEQVEIGAGLRAAIAREF